MTEQEAIERLKDHFRIHNDGRPTPYLDEAVSMAIAALEKQIPKKPYEPVEGDFACSCCDTYIAECVDDDCDMESELAGWCPVCGQKLDWSDE